MRHGLMVLLLLMLPIVAEAGWAIQRPDGTFRAWNANTQDDQLQPGETWVPLPTPPTIGPPVGGNPAPPICARIAAVAADPSVPATLKAYVALTKPGGCP